MKDFFVGSSQARFNLNTNLRHKMGLERREGQVRPSLAFGLLKCLLCNNITFASTSLSTSSRDMDRVHTYASWYGMVSKVFEGIVAVSTVLTSV